VGGAEPAAVAAVVGGANGAMTLTSRSDPVAGRRPPGTTRDQELVYLRALVEHAADMVSVIGSDGTLEYHYPPAVLGYSEGENFGRDVFDFVHPDDRDRALAVFAEALDRPGATEPFECRVRGADGSWRWMEIVGNNLADDPLVRGIVINGRDVTERRLAEDRLRQGEERFRSLLHHASELMLVWDAHGVITYASPSTVRFARGEEMVDATVDICATTADIHPDDAPLVIERVMQLMRCPGATDRFVARYRRHDGVYRALEVTVTNLLDDPEIGGVVSHSRDITEQQDAANELKTRAEWFRKLFQNGYDIIAVADADARIRYVSPSVEHLMGFAPGDLIGAHGFDFVHDDDLPAIAAHFAAVCATPGSHPPIEVRARRADGSWRWLEAVHTNLLDDPAVGGVVMNFRDVTERKQVEDQLAHQALHDALTALPNRVLLVDRLDQALVRARRSGTSVGVLFLDIDRFKLVNDTRGHADGDLLLAAVARRLRDAVRPSDTVARFGGDEFVVVYENIRNGDELTTVAGRLCDVLSQPFPIEGREVFVTVSIGAVIGKGRASSASLLRDADAAMYRGKEDGGGAVVAFDETIGLQAQRRYETEHALRLAVERDELDLVYQPIVTLDEGRIVGVEALLRWDHPTRGTVEPGDFVELAEETGLIVPIGAETLRRAGDQLRRWRAVPGMGDITMSVNVSGVQLRDSGFVETVTSVIADSGVNPSSLILEITESSLVDDTTSCLETLTSLTQLGVRLVVDDFGTRYSSLGYLNRMPLHGLKIDRLFVHRLGEHPRDAAIVSAILAMAGALDLAVVAEGVETVAQRTQLLELGCRLAQGFRFAKPQRTDDATAMIEAGRLTVA
jgi:diguanylate cyclase (GGDEF)-like protein/PAS domain S-box-containing protein